MQRFCNSHGHFKSASLSATLHTYQCWLKILLFREQHTVWICYFSQKIPVESAWFCYGRLSSPHSSTGLLHASVAPALPWLPWSPTAVSYLSQCIYGSLWGFFSSYLLEILAASLISLPLYMCALSSFYFCVVDRRLSGSGLVGTWKFQTSSLFLHIVILLLFHTLCTRTVDFRVGLESHSSCKNRTQKSTWTHLLWDSTYFATWRQTISIEKTNIVCSFACWGSAKLSWIINNITTSP